MARLEREEPRRGAALAIGVAGAAGLLVSTAFGPKAVVFGAVGLLAATLLALRDQTSPVFTWPNAFAALIAIVWLIPIKLYSLPIALPFNLEIYRVFLLLLIFAWAIAGIMGQAGVSAAGHGKPFVLLTAGAIATQIAYMRGLASDVESTEALKSLSYFLSFMVAFLLIASLVKSVGEVNRLVAVLVGGGAIVGMTALYESRTGHNLFGNLERFIPLDKEPREVFDIRGGRLRVYASAQHPIAFGCAMVLMLPLAMYLAQNAASKAGRRVWLAAALVIAAGALTTISRTTVVMAIVMVIWGLRLRPAMLVRYWPVLLVLPFVVHFFAPGALGGLWKSFFPQGGLVGDLNERAGQGGSGRFADISPGLDLWAESPVLGHGLGSQLSTGAPTDTGQVIAGSQPEQEIIFDNQYMNTLTSAGFIGLLAAIWFIWGAAIKLARSAKHTRGPPGDLIAACSVSCAGFAAAMFLFDAFSFVQCTLVFFIVAALGLKLRELTRLQPAS